MKNYNVFFAFGKAVESKESTPVKRYVGIAPVKVLAVNPTKAELEKLYNTTLDRTCPAGTTQYITGFESAWDGKVSCVPCPDGVCTKPLSCATEDGAGTKMCQYDIATKYN